MIVIAALGEVSAGKRIVSINERYIFSRDAEVAPSKQGRSGDRTKYGKQMVSEDEGRERERVRGRQVSEPIS